MSKTSNRCSGQTSLKTCPIRLLRKTGLSAGSTFSAADFLIGYKAYSLPRPAIYQEAEYLS